MFGPQDFRALKSSSPLLYHNALWGKGARPLLARSIPLPALATLERLLRAQALARGLRLAGLLHEGGGVGAVEMRDVEGRAPTHRGALECGNRRDVVH